MNRRAFLATIAGAFVAPHVRAADAVPDGISIRLVRTYIASSDEWVSRLDVCYGSGVPDGF